VRGGLRLLIGEIRGARAGARLLQQRCSTSHGEACMVAPWATG
jgi:hypothetical protein